MIHAYRVVITVGGHDMVILSETEPRGLLGVKNIPKRSIRQSQGVMVLVQILNA